MKCSIKVISYHLYSGHFDLVIRRRMVPDPTDDSVDRLSTNRELYKGSNFDLLTKRKVILLGQKQIGLLANKSQEIEITFKCL